MINFLKIYFFAFSPVSICCSSYDNFKATLLSKPIMMEYKSDRGKNLENTECMHYLSNLKRAGEDAFVDIRCFDYKEDWLQDIILSDEFKDFSSIEKLKFFYIFRKLMTDLPEQHIDLWAFLKDEDLNLSSAQVSQTQQPTESKSELSGSTETIQDFTIKGAMIALRARGLSADQVNKKIIDWIIFKAINLDMISPLFNN